MTMLSKAKFEDAARTTPPYFIQLIWLLSAFINCCREKGARPFIICAP